MTKRASPRRPTAELSPAVTDGRVRQRFFPAHSFADLRWSEIVWFRRISRATPGNKNRRPPFRPPDSRIMYRIRIPLVGAGRSPLPGSHSRALPLAVVPRQWRASRTESEEARERWAPSTPGSLRKPTEAVQRTV
ncbi:hypothetical protein MTO96_016679 [Rhipicephalus appendiculatus]